MWKWITKSKNIKNEMFSYKKEPLTGISLVLLVILNIFIFTNITLGIEEETRKAPSAYVYYPYSCDKHFEEVVTRYTSFSTYNHLNTRAKSNKFCSELHQIIKAIREDKVYIQTNKMLKKLNKQTKENNTLTLSIRGDYNTRLFEKIANENNSKINENKLKYDTIIQDTKELEVAKEALPKLETIEAYKVYVNYVKTNKKAYFEAKSSYEFWQPFYEYGHMLFFIIPLLVLFGFLYAREDKKEIQNKKYNPLIKTISANITFLLSLPLVWYTITLSWHILPQRLLADIIAFMDKYDLVSILYYIAIAIAILFFGGLIVYLQKRKMASRTAESYKIKKQKMISWSQCFNCEYKINYLQPYCPFCGTKLHEKCISCDKDTIINEKYCSNCGDEKDTK